MGYEARDHGILTGDRIWEVVQTMGTYWADSSWTSGEQCWSNIKEANRIGADGSSGNKMTAGRMDWLQSERQGLVSWKVWEKDRYRLGCEKVTDER